MKKINITKVILWLFLAIPYTLYPSPCLYAWSTKTYTSDSDFLSFSTEGLQIEGSGESAKLTTLHNWQKMVPTNSPSKRHASSMAYDRSVSSAVLFGGIDESNDPLQDLWVYDPADNYWTQKITSQVPASRFGHKIISISSGMFLLFGGEDNLGNVFDDTRIYNSNSNTWIQKELPVKPSPRAYFGMCYVPSNNKAYLFGGKNSSQLLNDFWVYDVSAGSWTNVVTGTVPTARYAPGMCFDLKNNSIILTGGRVNIIGGQTNDLWVYPLTANNWQNINQTSPNKPNPASDFIFEYIPGIERCIYFGGYSAGFENNTMLYNLNTNEWSTSGHPDSPSNRSGMAGFIFNDNIPYIFGGNTGSPDNEMWKYLIRSSGTFIITISTTVLTSVVWKDLITNNAGPVTSSTTIKYQIAHSDNGTNWSVFHGYDGQVSTFYTGAGPHSIWPGEWDRPYLKIKGGLNTSIPPVSTEFPEIKVTFNLRPYPPQLVYPQTEKRINQLKPVFIWNKAKDDDNDYPLTYHFQVSKDSTFASAAIDQDNIPETAGSAVEYTSVIGLNEGKWYWRLYSQDLNTSEWTTPYVFYVDTHPPSNVTELTAETGNENGKIVLIWASPGDDGTSGEIINGSCIIRYTASGPIVTENDWLNAEWETSQTFSAQPQSIVYASVKNLPDAATYYLAVKIQDPAGNVSVLSLNNPAGFTNAKPIVTLIEPKGSPGDTYAMLKEIIWAYSDPNSGDTATIAVKVSSDGGSNYGILIASGLPNGTTNYFWNTRQVCNADNYKIKIIVTDWRGLSGEAISANVFSIQNANEPPVVSLIYPNGGETLSGSECILWAISDINLTDTHDFFLYYSSDCGGSYNMMVELFQYATFYYWDTALLKNGTNYMLKIIAKENNTNERYSAQNVSQNTFILDNGNKNPNSFSLITPADKSNVSILNIELEWENTGDPNPGDSLLYTLYYSTSSDFSNARTVNITGNKYLLSARELSEEKTYYWKVKAADQLGTFRFSNGVFSFFVLNRNNAISKDSLVSGKVVSGLPDNGYLFIEKINPDNCPWSASIMTAKDFSIGDRLMKVISNDIYKIEVMDIDQQALVVNENLQVNLSFKYNDSDNDGYCDGASIPVDKLKIAHLDESAGKWVFPEASQTISLKSKEISVPVKGLSLFTIIGTNVPERLLSNINIFPNPFQAGRESNHIRYVLNKDAEVEIWIYNLIGGLVKQWKFGSGMEGRSKGLPTGYTNEIQWDGKNGLERVVANGMYLCVIAAKASGENQRELRYIGVVK